MWDVWLARTYNDWYSYFAPLILGAWKVQAYSPSVPFFFISGLYWFSERGMLAIQTRCWSELILEGLLIIVWGEGIRSPFPETVGLWEVPWGARWGNRRSGGLGVCWRYLLRSELPPAPFPQLVTLLSMLSRPLYYCATPRSALQVHVCAHSQI